MALKENVSTQIVHLHLRFCVINSLIACVRLSSLSMPMQLAICFSINFYIIRTFFVMGLCRVLDAVRGLLVVYSYFANDYFNQMYYI